MLKGETELETQCSLQLRQWSRRASKKGSFMQPFWRSYRKYITNKVQRVGRFPVSRQVGSSERRCLS